MTEKSDKTYTVTLGEDDFCIAIAAQCAGIQKVIDMNEWHAARRYKAVTDMLMAQAKAQGLDVLSHVESKAEKEREDHAAADE